MLFTLTAVLLQPVTGGAVDDAVSDRDSPSAG